MINSTDMKHAQGLIEYLEHVPYDVTRRALYTPDELYRGYTPEREESLDQCFDSKVYAHYLRHGKQPSTSAESLARALHDHGMSGALSAFVEQCGKHRCVGIMGGHAQLRTDPTYRQVANISKRLTEQGFTMLSGGGPGAMEATHLGAWMAGRSDTEFEQAMQILCAAPSFRDRGWLPTAMQVMRKFAQEEHQSLGIPTWLYGHEPSTPLATHIAKFFDNSIREDRILTLPYGGIVYTPGSAGTMQEIFQDAVQNHYLSVGLSSPMIFLGRTFWTQEMPVYTMLRQMTEMGKYNNLLLTLTDDTEEVIAALQDFQTKFLSSTHASIPQNLA